MPSLGVIGLGLLGGALAARLSQHGFEVRGFDCDPVRRQAAANAGVLVHDSAQAVFDTCDRVLLSLPTSQIVREVLLSATIRPGAVVIDTTTGDPDDMAALGAELAARGAAYVDATVAGSSADAARGEVIVMAGGDGRVVAVQQDVFAAFARQVFPTGPIGSGARMKLVVNLVLGLNRAVLAEGLAFAEASGIDPAGALEVLKTGPAASRVMETKGPKMLARDFTPVARLAQHLKDVRLILDQGGRSGAHLPLSELHAALLSNLVDRGFGDEDNSAILRAFDR